MSGELLPPLNRSTAHSLGTHIFIKFLLLILVMMPEMEDQKMDKDGVTKKEVSGIEHVFGGEMVRPIYTLTEFTH